MPVWKCLVEFVCGMPSVPSSAAKYLFNRIVEICRRFFFRSTFFCTKVELGLRRNDKVDNFNGHQTYMAMTSHTMIFLLFYHSRHSFATTSLRTNGTWNGEKMAMRLDLLWFECFIIIFSYLDEVESRCGNVFARRIRVKRLDPEYRRPVCTMCAERLRLRHTKIVIFARTQMFFHRFIRRRHVRTSPWFSVYYFLFLFRLLRFGVFCMLSDAQMYKST